MTQKDRDRLIALKRAKKKLITQKQAAAELGVSERQERRMLRSLKDCGDKAVVHAGLGRRSNPKLSDYSQKKAIDPEPASYRGFGPL